MGIKEIWNFIWQAILALGGISVIVMAVVKFCSDRIAEKLQLKYQLKLDKEMEVFRSQIESKSYVSRAYFDREFKIYQDLFKVLFGMIKRTSIMIPSGYHTVPEKREDRLRLDNENYERARKAFEIFQDTLSQSAPFIPKSIYDKCSEIERLCSLQLSEHEERYVVSDLRPQTEKETYSREAHNRTREINKLYDYLVEEMRRYLKSLEIQ